MVSFLDMYKKQVDEDRQNETYDIEVSPDMAMTKDEYEEYKKEVDALREKMYVETPKQMAAKIESKSYPKELVADKVDFPKVTYNDADLSVTLHDLDAGLHFAVKRAKCPFCGKEIQTKTPSMYNMVTLGKSNHYSCDGCGNTYTINGSYPRVVMLDADNNETNIHLF